jgi:Cu/Ag efflux protein CusF
MSDPSKDLDLPNITMVFAIMEGGKAFMKKMRREAEQVGGLA